MASKTAKVEYFQDEANEWRWRVKARNGRIVAGSLEGYSSRKDAKRAFTTVFQAVSDAFVSEGTDQ